MKTYLIIGLGAALLSLAACDDGPETNAATAPAAGVEPESRTERDARAAGEAIGDAARATGTAAGSAFEDLRDASGPALQRAREQSERALEGAQRGLNDLTRGAACQTSRAANDAEGIAANC